jgi:hypothetical protein
MADESSADAVQDAAGSIRENLPERYIGDVVADLNRRINAEQAAANEDLTSERTQSLSQAQSLLVPYVTTGQITDEALAEAHQIVAREPPPPITRVKPEPEKPDLSRTSTAEAPADQQAGDKPAQAATQEQPDVPQDKPEAATQTPPDDLQSKAKQEADPLESPEIPPLAEQADIEAIGPPAVKADKLAPQEPERPDVTPQEARPPSPATAPPAPAPPPQSVARAIATAPAGLLAETANGTQLRIQSMPVGRVTPDQQEVVLHDGSTAPLSSIAKLRDKSGQLLWSRPQAPVAEPPDRDAQPTSAVPVATDRSTAKPPDSEVPPVATQTRSPVTAASPAVPVAHESGTARPADSQATPETRVEPSPATYETPEAPAAPRRPEPPSGPAVEFSPTSTTKPSASESVSPAVPVPTSREAAKPTTPPASTGIPETAPPPRWIDYFRDNRQQEIGVVRSAIAATSEYATARLNRAPAPQPSSPDPSPATASTAPPRSLPATPTHYERLGVPSTATKDEILIAYEEKRKDAKSLEEREPLAQAARALLKPETRQAYDQQLADQQRQSPPAVPVAPAARPAHAGKPQQSVAQIQSTPPPPAVPVTPGTGTQKPAETTVQGAPDDAATPASPHTSTPSPPTTAAPGASGFGTPPTRPPTTASPAAPSPEPDPSRGLFSKIASAITGAIQSVVPGRQNAADQVQAADRAAQQAGGTTAPQHPLVQAAGKKLAADQDLARQNQEQFTAAQTSDEGLPPTLQSPEAYYAAAKLGYRPGDRRATSAAGRRDRSDDPGLQWRDLGDVDQESRHEAASRLQDTRELVRENAEIPPEKEALAQALRRNENLTAADAYVIQQRQAHGTDPEAAQKRKASFAERFVGIKDDDEDGLRTAKMVGAVEYGEHAIRQYSAAAAQGAAPFVGEAPAAIAGSAGQAAAGLAGGAGTMVAGAATGNPLLVAKGMADLGAEVVKLPGMLVDWSDALIASADNIKQFSSVLANAFAVAELRTMRRDFESAQRTGDASANLIDARQDLADTLQPVKDQVTNTLSKDIANGLLDLNDIVSILRDLAQWAGVMTSDEELKAELERKGTPFQETIRGIEAGGFAAQDKEGKWVQTDLQGGFSGAGMGNAPSAGHRPGTGVAGGAGVSGSRPWQRDPGAVDPNAPQGGAAKPSGPNRGGIADLEKSRKEMRDRLEAQLDREYSLLAGRGATGPAATQDELDEQRAKAAKQIADFDANTGRMVQRQVDNARAAGQGQAPGRAPQRAPNAPQLPGDAPDSPFPGMPGPMRDRRGQKIPKVHAQPEEPARGYSGMAGALLGASSGGTASAAYLLWKLARGEIQTDTAPPAQEAKNLP